MAELDFLNNERFSYRKITEGMILMPNRFNTLEKWGLFPEVSIDTTYVELDIEQFKINIIPVGTRGGPAPKAERTTRVSKVQKVFHYPLDDYLRADDLQNAIALANAGQFQRFDVEMAKKLMIMKMKFDQTREFLRWGALQGKIYDADGTTLLLDLLPFMGKTKYNMDLKLGSAAGKPVASAISRYKDHLALNMEGDQFTSIVCPMTRTLFDRFLAHQEIIDAYREYPSAQDPLRNDVSDAFLYKGVVFRVELGRATHNAPDGTSYSNTFITANEGVGIPVGTLQTFRSYNAPADFIDTINTLGQPMYARTDLMKYNRGVDIHAQMNTLQMNLRPQTVARVFSST